MALKDNKKFYIALDVGGTEIKSALVDDGGCLLSVVDYSPSNSRASQDAILKNLCDTIEKYINEEHHVDGIGLGIPGPFDYKNGVSQISGSGVVDGVGKFDALYGFELGEYLENRFGLPVRFANDADLYALGEYHFGVGQGSHRMLCVCIGTGLGSGFLVDGVLQKYIEGITDDGWLYRLPFEGKTVDDMLSATALNRMIAKNCHSAKNGKELFLAAEAGDVAAAEIFLQFGQRFARFFPHILQRLEADRFVIGGQAAASFKYFGEPLTAVLPRGMVHISSGSASLALSAVSLLFMVD